MSEDDLEVQICQQCVGDPYLARLVAQTGRRRACSYCGEFASSYAIGDLANEIERAFHQHYRLTPNEPDAFQSSMMSDKEGTYDWTRSGDPVAYVLDDMISLPDGAATAILELLRDRHHDFDDAKAGIENPFDSDAHYAPIHISDISLRFGWQEIEAALKKRSRFFVREAKNFLDSIFSGINGRSTIDGRALLVCAGPGTDITGFYRARSFEQEEELVKALARPDLHLGPPPAHLARAGRMNAEGISVFYGAETEAVAIAEIRPPVGSRALTGKFMLTTEVMLLDLQALASMYVAGSEFDPDYADQLARARFLKRLVQQMTLPVTPTVEKSEYLVTQMIADYLSEASGLDIAGILFPSVQRRDDPARNVVLFQFAARVDVPDLPEGTAIEPSVYRHGDDVDEIEYHVSEYTPEEPVPPSDKPGMSDNASWAMSPFLYDAMTDERVPILAVDAHSLAVHAIDRIEIKAARQTVTRFRGERSVPKF